MQPIGNKTGLTIETKGEQSAIDPTANKITMTMVRALIKARKDGLNFKQLAERHINIKLEEDINKLDARAQKIYKELFIKTFAFVKQNSNILVMTLASINAQTNDAAASGKFLGSFVLNEIKETKASSPAKGNPA